MAKKADTVHFLNSELDKRAKKAKVQTSVSQRGIDPVKVAKVIVKNAIIKGK